ncbi:DAK2 domain-containing protein [Raoultibacter phocaeensis]|uniref:DAK2 domain-containing protein n=1 Tax=Raoultibacter phocaeensis TaxID=2479841 RepID=UPI00111BAD45|nr:DAK2 domain-containing protein [Raoultibacter phocaeensis]
MIDKRILSAMLAESAQALATESDLLSEIDSKFGDGDHGITMTKIAKLIDQEVAAWDSEPIGSFLDALGCKAMEVKGGSAGPLYGTLISGLGYELDDDEDELGPDAVKRMFSGCLSEMQDITTAQVGDKTMMDALIPACGAAADAADDVEAILEAASDGAAAGARDSERYASKFGRAKSYKEATIGTPDAGAVSTSLFIHGLYEGYLAAQAD